MEYNTQRPTLLMPEYGRMVQQMVNEAIQIEDRTERTRYAEAIIGVMRGLNPQMKNVPNYREKLWDHLAYISGYQLDIDYPFDIHTVEKSTPPAIPYPSHQVNYRHYGTLIERALQEIGTLPNNEEKVGLLRGVGTRMKRCIADFRDEQPDDRRVEHDIERITDGKTTANFSAHPLAYIKTENKESGKKRRKK